MMDRCRYLDHGDLTSAGCCCGGVTIGFGALALMDVLRVTLTKSFFVRVVISSAQRFADCGAGRR